MNKEKTFANILEEKKISGYRLSKTSGISQSAIAAWVSGSRDILKAELSSVIKICKALDMTVEELENRLK